jgi:hypothetical protein
MQIIETLVFNTGRQYSDKGQRIAAGKLTDGSILFVDIDRGLEYLIAPGAARFTQSSIMGAYDRGGLDWVNNHALIQELSAAAAAAN